MLWLILSVLLWGLLHSLLASHKAKELARQALGSAAGRLYRLVYNLFACFSFLPVLALAALTPDRQLYLIPFPWAALLLAGELLSVVALIFGFLQTDAKEFLGLRQLAEQESVRPATIRLVTTGLYRYVRHPLYTAGLVFIWLMPLMTVNVLAINIGLTVYVIIGAYFEELKLLSVFGEEYARYRAVTPMLIPGLKWNKRHPASS